MQNHRGTKGVPVIIPVHVHPFFNDNVAEHFQHFPKKVLIIQLVETSYLKMHEIGIVSHFVATWKVLDIDERPTQQHISRPFCCRFCRCWVGQNCLLAIVVLWMGVAVVGFYLPPLLLPLLPIYHL